MQLDPPLGSSRAGLLDTARSLHESGLVGFVDINDNATARAGMSSLMVSAAIERECGIETIPHLTTRDWTVMGLESMLLGAHAEGVRNVLAITGDPPEVGDYPGAQGVYEIDAIGLTKLMSQLNRGEDFNGRPIDAPTSFYVGVAVNPTADDLELEVERFRQKLAEGAKYAMTQIVFELESLERFAELLGGTWPIPVLIGVFPLTSHRLALRLHNEVPGILVPEELQEELDRAGSSASEVGMAHAKELDRRRPRALRGRLCGGALPAAAGRARLAHAVALRADRLGERAPWVFARPQALEREAEVVPGLPAELGPGACIDVHAIDAQGTSSSRAAAYSSS